MDERIIFYILATILSTVGFFYLYREAKERKKIFKKEQQKEKDKVFSKVKRKEK